MSFGAIPLTSLSGDDQYWNWLNGGNLEPSIGPSYGSADLVETQNAAWLRERALAYYSDTPGVKAINNQPQLQVPGAGYQVLAGQGPGHGGQVSVASNQQSAVSLQNLWPFLALVGILILIATK